MVCWKGYSLYGCTAEFRFFWVQSELAETVRLVLVIHLTCTTSLCSVYFLFLTVTKADFTQLIQDIHYLMSRMGCCFITNMHIIILEILVLIWKDERCSQYVIDTNNNGQVPHQQHIILELQDEGKLVTSDDPPVPFDCLNADLVKQSGLSSGRLIRFAIGDGGLSCVDGRTDKADLQYIGVSNRARAFAGSYSKIMFQDMARRSPLKVEDLAFICLHEKPLEAEMSEVDASTFSHEKPLDVDMSD